MSPRVLGIIGGSGLYDIEMFNDVELLDVETPWGKPSSKLSIAKLGDLNICFISRHGTEHNIAPSKINYRANIYALKKYGVTDIVSFSAVGSLDDSIHPGMLVINDQFIDNTYKRCNTFFDADMVAHVSMAMPVSQALSSECEKVVKKLKYKYKYATTYVAIEGPQFSTHAESKMFKSLGGHVIGMTNMPEAKLAREAEIRYATIGMVTDYDCYKSEYMNVDIGKMIEILHENVKKAKALIPLLADSLKNNNISKDPISVCLDTAIITNLNKVNKKTKDMLGLIIKRYEKDNK